MQKIIGTVQTLPQQISGEIKPTVASSGDEYAKGYNEGYENGKNSVTDFARLCSHIQFSDLNVLGKEDVTLNLDNVTTFYNFYYSPSKEPKPPSNTTVKHLTINCPNKVTSLRQAFDRTYRSDNTLEHLTLNVDTSEVTDVYYSFCTLRALKIIDGQPLSFANVSSISTFRSLDSLEEVRFVENSIYANIGVNHSPKLSAISIQSIIDGLADLTGQTQQTITWHTDVILKLTPDQLLQIKNKNWTSR